VTGFQWQWQFEYPEYGVRVLGTPEQDPVLVLPSSSSVQFDLISLDVIHSFWITAFRFKRDIIPGQPSSFTVDTIDTTGSFPNAGVCAEFCGLDHALMRFGVEVLPDDEFAVWLSKQQAIEGVTTS
jgi:cytochrome c oxidase subunit 2